MKIYFLLFSAFIMLSSAIADSALAQTGPLVEIQRKLTPIAKIFNQPGLLGGRIDPQAALIDRVVAIVSIFLGFLAIIFIILVLYGGYLWMTAAGNEQRVEEARNVLKRAIVGIIIVLGAAVITNTVILELLKAMD